MLNLHSPISDLYRVGKATSSLLKKLGLDKVQDLLFYLPFRYEDFSLREKISALQPGMNANVIGTIELIENRKSRKKRMYVTEALVSDDSGTLKVVWFNQAFLTRSYQIGDQISLAGKVSDSYGQLCLISPVAEKIYAQGLIHTSGLIPNYHLSGSLTQKQIRFLVKEALPLVAKIEDWIPADIKKRLHLLSINSALQKIHFPKNKEEILAARKRLTFNELFLRQLKAQIIKRELKSRQAPKILFHQTETKNFVDSLPFKLTDAQRRASWEILQDLGKSTPMSRLLAGDVGSGKTLVVILALLNTALNKKQAALMVPTEILARQHYQTISHLLKPYHLSIKLLIGSSAPTDKKEALEADIIIGTHALIQKNINLPKLALAVVDEQHRFGVVQRKKLLDFKQTGQLTPHFLSLTATPIPRSLTLAIYGDLDLSLINEKPVGRKEILTKIVNEQKRTAAYNFIRQHISAGEQAFVICPLIDPSDKSGLKSVKAEHERLDKDIFPDLKVGLLHGRLKSTEKDKIMSDFAANKLSVLVSTSLIEVGVDIPNATMMLIEGAERFGLAQLHQFRGRIGRSQKQSYCFLFPSREETASPKTMARLEALSKHQDGLTLAKIDLKLRGAGEIYGTGQSGFPELQIASLFDYGSIKQAQSEAAVLIASDPELKKFPELKAKLGEWESHWHLE